MWIQWEKPEMSLAPRPDCVRACQYHEGCGRCRVGEAHATHHFERVTVGLVGSLFQEGFAQLVEGGDGGAVFDLLAVAWETVVEHAWLRAGDSDIYRSDRFVF